MGNLCVLLEKWQTHIHMQSNGIVIHLNAFIKILCGLWIKAKVIKYTEAHYAFHASTRELANHPDFN